MSSSSDSDDSSSSEGSAEPQRILIEDRTTRSNWVDATPEERTTIEKAMTMAAQLPEPRVGVDAAFKPDFLATAPSFRIMRIRYLGNDYLWLREEKSRTERRILALPEHHGSMGWSHYAPRNQKALPIDRKAERTWETLGLPDSYLERVRRESGTFFLQNNDPNEWREAPAEMTEALVRGVAAIESQHDQPPDKFVHLVTVPKTKGKASLQIFRAPDHSLWVAEIKQGFGKEQFFLRFIVAGEHRPARA